MYAFITILIIIACILLTIVVLIQNPKGGGLSQTFGGVSSQFFGVRQTTDFIEKATWGLIIFVGAFCLLTSMVKPKVQATQGESQGRLEQMTGKGGIPAFPAQQQAAPPPQQQPQPQQQQPQPQQQQKPKPRKPAL